jgi:hypothetical protein
MKLASRVACWFLAVVSDVVKLVFSWGTNE